ncbi:MAG: helix-turn-helix transcriptional regulator [Cyanobacteria bacterium SBLK]|nr:helix-turn-helix transcriptional regulator [Cyanobacteria bacterium SBLK]
MQIPEVIDYRQKNAANALLPEPSILSSSGWNDIHFELFQQPSFEIVEHSHTMHAIASAYAHPLQKEGNSNLSGERWLDGKRQYETRKEGDIAIIPAGISHRCNWKNSVQFGVLALEPVLLKQVGQDWLDPDRIELMPRFMSERDPFIQSILTTLKNELETAGIASLLLVDSLKTALAIHLLRNYCTLSPKSSHYSEGLSRSQLMLVTDYIREHLDEELKLVDLAALVRMSPYYFLRLFKQSLGITPHQYILRNRLDRAKSLLQQGNSNIAEVAVTVGFCDRSHLTRYFKRAFGLTPKQFVGERSQ